MKYDKAIVAIKEKHISVANAGLYRPSEVINRLTLQGINKNMNWHTEMWRKFKVRPSSNSKDKTSCKTDYCMYDRAHKDYLYTEAWINLLVDQNNANMKKVKPRK